MLYRKTGVFVLSKYTALLTNTCEICFQRFHLLGFSRPKRMPFPEQIVVTPASENDLNVFKQNWSDIPNRTFFGDKIYYNDNYLEDLKNQIN